MKLILKTALFSVIFAYGMPLLGMESQVTLFKTTDGQEIALEKSIVSQSGTLTWLSQQVSQESGHSIPLEVSTKTLKGITQMLNSVAQELKQDPQWSLAAWLFEKNIQFSDQTIKEISYLDIPVINKALETIGYTINPGTATVDFFTAKYIETNAFTDLEALEMQEQEMLDFIVKRDTKIPATKTVSSEVLDSYSFAQGIEDDLTDKKYQKQRKGEKQQDKKRKHDDITVLTRDGKNVYLAKETLKKAKTLSNSFEDTIQEENELSLPFYFRDAFLLKEVLEILAQEELSPEQQVLRIKDFVHAKQFTARELIALAKIADYSDCQPLLEATTTLIADECYQKYQRGTFFSEKQPLDNSLAVLTRKKVIDTVLEQFFKEETQAFTLNSSKYCLLGNFLLEVGRDLVFTDLHTKHQIKLENDKSDSNTFFFQFRYSKESNTLAAIYQHEETVVLWDANTGKCILKIDLGLPSNSITSITCKSIKFSQDGSKLFIVFNRLVRDGHIHELYTYDIAMKKFYKIFEGTAQPKASDFVWSSEDACCLIERPDADTYAFTFFDRDNLLHGKTSFNSPFTLKHWGLGLLCGIGYDDLISYDELTQTIEIWDYNTQKVIDTITLGSLPQTVSKLAYAADRRKVALLLCERQDGFIKTASIAFYDRDTKELVKSLDITAELLKVTTPFGLGCAEVTDFKFTTDNEFIIVTQRRFTNLWHTNSHEHLLLGDIGALEHSTSGKLVVATNNRDQISVFNLFSPEFKKALQEIDLESALFVEYALAAEKPTPLTKHEWELYKNLPQALQSFVQPKIAKE